MRYVWRVFKLLALPTLALGIALLIAPDRAELEVHVWLLVVLGFAFFALIAAVHAAFPTSDSPFLASMRREEVAVERPSSLARVEREVSIACTSAFDTHQRFRPSLIELARGLLASRRGIDLDGEPDRARAVLGDDLWELVRPDRPRPTDKQAGGIDEEQLGRIVVALERI